MKRTILTTFLSLTLLFGANASDSTSLAGMSKDELFKKGNEAYVDDRFQESIEYYLQILENESESAELYFNLGNAYFKLGDLPNSILFYEKARMLDPMNEDIKTNLDIANLKTVDKVEGKPELPFSAWWTDILNSNLIDEWAMKSIYLSVLGGLLLVLYLFSRGVLRKASFFTSLFAFFISLIFYFMGMQQKSNQQNHTHAIVFNASVTVKGSPEDDGTKLFVIHEGTKVEILDKEGEWSEISLMNGNKGWVKTDVYRPI